VPIEQDVWDLFASAGLRPDQEAEQSELLAAIRQAIAEALSPHQRRVLIALAMDGVPIDVLAERLGTTRGALYKTLHDARRKLRRQLAAEGHSLGGRTTETTL
jgi:RNA polymerase sigma-70 factor (ECF subfamily)